MLQKKATPQPSPQMPSPMSTPQRQSETVIGPGIKIKGDLNGTSNIMVMGTLEGNVQLDGRVVVGAGGVLVGDITATNVVVEGAVTGNIDAQGKVELGSRSQTKGNIQAGTLSIQEGAYFEGRVSDRPTNGKQPSATPIHEPDTIKTPVYQ
jgi:cytoskeletal protein CcmA (bactofilin family)